MKKTSIVSIVAAVVLVGCGSGGTTYQSSGKAVPEVANPAGTSLIVTASEGSQVGVSYTEVGDGGILVDCGAGGCGEVNLAEQIGSDTGTCTSGAQGDCPDGYFWCPIENKCLPA